VPALGERVGGGGSSEVFAWADGRVVKLFLARYEHAVESERDRADAVHRAGVASPAVHDVVAVDGRRGIVFERVDGPTLLDQLVRGDRRPADVGRALAEVHLAMHAAEAPDLPDLAAVLGARGRRVPAGRVVFHGDFHPGNVIVGPRGRVTIDWVNAHLAPAAADVARTVMAVRYQALRRDQPGDALARERSVRARVLDAYLTAYLDSAPIAVGDLALWLGETASGLRRSEPDSADADDLRALTARRHGDVAEPSLHRLLTTA
jgi:streptomycin 6-kinase